MSSKCAGVGGQMLLHVKKYSSLIEIIFTPLALPHTNILVGNPKGGRSNLLTDPARRMLTAGCEREAKL